MHMRHLACNFNVFFAKINLHLVAWLGLKPVGRRHVLKLDLMPEASDEAVEDVLPHFHSIFFLDQPDGHRAAAFCPEKKCLGIFSMGLEEGKAGAGTPADFQWNNALDVPPDGLAGHAQRAMDVPDALPLLMQSQNALLN